VEAVAAAVEAIEDVVAHDRGVRDAERTSGEGVRAGPGVAGQVPGRDGQPFDLRRMLQIANLIAIPVIRRISRLILTGKKNGPHWEDAYGNHSKGYQPRRWIASRPVGPQFRAPTGELFP